MPARLTPLKPTTPDALITGDPRRAFALALELTGQPVMSHQARGLWGYTGITETGLPLTVQSTGSGGPAAAAAIGDLAELGVTRLIRLGTCVAPSSSHPAGTAVLIERAIGLDGASAALSTGDTPPGPDPGLLAQLEGVAPAGTVSSHDLVARHDPRGTSPSAVADVRDLQTAVVFAASKRHGIRAAALLVVSGDGTETGLAEQEINEILIEVGRQVLARLGKDEP